MRTAFRPPEAKSNLGLYQIWTGGGPAKITLGVVSTAAKVPAKKFRLVRRLPMRTHHPMVRRCSPSYGETRIGESTTVVSGKWGTTSRCLA